MFPPAFDVENPFEEVDLGPSHFGFEDAPPQCRARRRAEKASCQLDCIVLLQEDTRIAAGVGRKVELSDGLSVKSKALSQYSRLHVGIRPGSAQFRR